MRKIYRNKATLLSSLHIVYSRHHELVDRCEISISQMTMDLFTFNVDVFLSSITDKIQEVLTLRGQLVGFRFFLCPFRVAHHFSFLWFFFILSVIVLFLVANVAGVSILSILEFPFGLLWRLFTIMRQFLVCIVSQNSLKLKINTEVDLFIY
jgi:hypothetical protein